LNLIAGKRAKSSTAYASALSYLRAARALLTDKDWDEDYGLIFSIEYDTAECELLTADMVAAENRLSILAHRAKRAHDVAFVTRLRVTLYTIWVGAIAVSRYVLNTCEAAALIGRCTRPAMK